MTDLTVIVVVQSVTTIIVAGINILGKRQTQHQIKEVHEQINGRMGELLKANKIIDTEVGKEIGRAELLNEQDPNTDTEPKK